MNENAIHNVMLPIVERWRSEGDGIFQPDPESGIRQEFFHDARQFEEFLLGHALSLVARRLAAVSCRHGLRGSAVPINRKLAADQWTDNPRLTRMGP